MALLPGKRVVHSIVHINFYIYLKLKSNDFQCKMENIL